MGWEYETFITLLGPQEDRENFVKDYFAMEHYSPEVVSSNDGKTRIIECYRNAYNIRDMEDNIIQKYPNLEVIACWASQGMGSYGHKRYFNGDLIESRDEMVPRYEIPHLNYDTNLWEYWTVEELKEIAKQYHENK
jgi:hypothetical protein